MVPSTIWCWWLSLRECFVHWLCVHISPTRLTTSTPPYELTTATSSGWYVVGIFCFSQQLRPSLMNLHWAKWSNIPLPSPWQHNDIHEQTHPTLIVSWTMNTSTMRSQCLHWLHTHTHTHTHTQACVPKWEHESSPKFWSHYIPSTAHMRNTMNNPQSLFPL